MVELATILICLKGMNPFTKIEKATITLVKKGGQGILIKNKMILTASHCVNYSLSGEMMLGNYYVENISTRSGNLVVSPVCIEPIKDIAILGPVDSQELHNEYRLYDEFCGNTFPVKVCRSKIEVGKKFNIFIYTHKKKWITGKAKLSFPDSPVLWIEVDEQIKGGTSGSAIVNEKGEIVGIVTNASESEKSDGMAPRPLLTLPVWICRMI